MASSLPVDSSTPSPPTTSTSTSPPFAQDRLNTPPPFRPKLFSLFDESTTWQRDPTERLSLPPNLRITLAAGCGAIIGIALGMSHGGKGAALRFRAENAHRLPVSQKGWYFYHKSKSYHTLVGGVREAVRMGGYVGVWVGTFFAFEEGVDTFRGGRRERDAASTVLAAMGTAGLFSLWNRLPIPTAARTARTAFKIGLGYGLGQDLLSVLRGRELRYVESMKRLVGSTGQAG